MKNKLWLSDQPHQPWRQCPYCLVLHDAVTGINDKPGVHLDPDERETLLICIECGNWGVVDRTVEGGWRRPTNDETRHVMRDNTFLLALSATRAIAERRGGQA